MTETAMETPTVDGRALTQRYQATMMRYIDRDVAMGRIYAARNNRLREIAPDLLPEDGPYSHPVIANTLDTAARDMAEQISPLPQITCLSSKMTDDKDLQRASMRTKIANAYTVGSRLQQQMASGADWFVTYGFLVGKAEADFERKTPAIRLVDPRGIYPVYDRYGRLIAVFQRLVLREDVLCEQYPEYRDQILPNSRRDQAPSGALVEVVFYHDKNVDTVLLPSRNGLVLSTDKNVVGKVLWRVARRPGLDPENPRGQFDDVVWPQIFRNAHSLLKQEAATKAVRAPLVLPTDVRQAAFGPDAVIQTNNPQGVGRVNLELPQSAFAQDQQLEREVMLGSRYPESRTGTSSQSVVTGRGVQELQGGFDSQISSYQSGISEFLVDLIGLCFELDEKLWPGEAKVIRGHAEGSPYEVKYKPAKDIKGDYTVEVSYGMAAGLDPNRALIWTLQAQSAELISTDTARRNLPGQIDVQAEAQKVDVENLRKALLSSVQQYGMAIPAMAQQGQDPSNVIRQVAQVLQGRTEGRPIEQLVLEAFAPPPAPAPADPDADGDTDPAGQPDSDGGDQTGFGPGQGLGSGAGPVDQATQGFPGSNVEGRPDMMQLLAGLTSRGQPNLQANVARSMAV